MALNNSLLLLARALFLGLSLLSINSLLHSYESNLNPELITALNKFMNSVLKHDPGLANYMCEEICARKVSSESSSGNMLEKKDLCLKSFVHDLFTGPGKLFVQLLEQEYGKKWYEHIPFVDLSAEHDQDEVEDKVRNIVLKGGKSAVWGCYNQNIPFIAIAYTADELKDAVITQFFTSTSEPLRIGVPGVFQSLGWKFEPATEKYLLQLKSFGVTFPSFLVFSQDPSARYLDDADMFKNLADIISKGTITVYIHVDKEGYSMRTGTNRPVTLRLYNPSDN